MKLSPLIVALDLENTRQVEAILKKLGPAVDFYKVGLKLYTHYGPDVIRLLKKRRKNIFLDLKFHDIPNTVAEACREAVRLKVQMLTLHASGGSEMMQAAVQATRQEARRLKVPKPLLMGVTVLTSMNSLKEVGVPKRPVDQVVTLAKLAQKNGMDGVICSPLEIARLRRVLPKKFKIVTPGIRPAGSSTDDQKRVMTPAQAFTQGVDALVVGRPILRSKHPQRVVRQFINNRSS